MSHSVHKYADAVTGAPGQDFISSP